MSPWQLTNFGPFDAQQEVRPGVLRLDSGGGPPLACKFARRRRSIAMHARDVCFRRIKQPVNRRVVFDVDGNQ
jgi:hypothetical protein